MISQTVCNLKTEHQLTPADTSHNDMSVISVLYIAIGQMTSSDVI